MEDNQVKVRVVTDPYYTADFLRELAVAIEDEGTDLTSYESEHGYAELEWPDSMLDEEDDE